MFEKGGINTYTGRSGECSPNAVWITLLLVYTFLLIFARFITLFLKHITLAPGILGTVSSLRRDNPYEVLPPGGSVLGGIVRAKRLWNVRVAVKDVHEHQSVEHIALTTAASGSGAWKLSKQRRHL